MAGWSSGITLELADSFQKTLDGSFEVVDAFDRALVLVARFAATDEDASALNADKSTFTLELLNRALDRHGGDAVSLRKHATGFKRLSWRELACVDSSAKIIRDLFVRRTLATRVDHHHTGNSSAY